MGNTIGKILKLTTFGESHGPAVGGIIDGFPAGIKVDFELVSNELKRRSAANTPYSTTRYEPDEPEFLSGIFEGITTGTPIAFIIRNRKHNSAEYENLKNIFRASHADYGYFAKYGIRDHRGGGRASARETISRVVGGAFAKMLLSKYGISITSYITSLCGIKVNNIDLNYLKKSLLNIPDKEAEKIIVSELEKIKKEKNSCGGIIETIVKNVPAGLGEPVFDKLDALIARAILSIPAVKGIEFGDGFDFANSTANDVYDEFIVKDGKITTRQNHNGGIIGGLSTGNDIIFRTVFKPVSTVPQKRNTVTISKQPTTYTPSGRHDITVLPRATVIVESMTALVIADMILCNMAANAN